MDVKASFRCDEKTLNDFRKLVALKYGRLYGVLHREFNKALEERAKKLQKELKITTIDL